MIAVALALYAAGWIVGLSGQPAWGIGFGVVFLPLWFIAVTRRFTPRDASVTSGFDTAQVAEMEPE